MFFSWLIKNRHFKKGSDIKGQITPLLIIVMVVLLVAALVSINIGRIALDKTYSSNASDAGALAAASIYDAAFNELARSWTSPTDDASSPGGLNYKMFMNYLSSYSAYYVLYEGASNNIETAIIEALAGQALAIAAYVQAAIFPPIDTVWVLALTGAITAAAAGLLIWSAAREVEEFYLRAQYMLSITESFHDGQWNFYAVDTSATQLSIRGFMDETRQSAIESGYSYAFSNSGITQKLSLAQTDAYSAWILSTDKNYLSGKYEWTDSLSKNHKVEVGVDVPWILAYDLQHCRSSYPDIKDHLNTMIDRAPLIEAAMTAMYSSISTFGAILVIGFIISIIQVIFTNCCVSVVGSAFCCAEAVTFYGYEISLWQTFVDGFMPLVLVILTTLLAIAGSISLYLLQNENDDAYDGWLTDEPGNVHVYRNSRLGPPYANNSFNDAVAKDLMIVRIYNVVMQSWNVNVSDKQTHPGTTQGIIPTRYPVANSLTVVDFYGPPYSGGNQDPSYKIWNFVDSFDNKITSIR